MSSPLLRLGFMFDSVLFFFVSDFLLKLVEISLLRIVVMDRGSIAEMDSPAQLIRLKGHFYQMCLGAGLA